MLDSYYPSRRSVWENPDQGCEYRPSAVMSVHTTEVRIVNLVVPSPCGTQIFRIHGFIFPVCKGGKYLTYFLGLCLKLTTLSLPGNEQFHSL